MNSFSHQKPGRSYVELICDHRKHPRLRRSSVRLGGGYDCGRTCVDEKTSGSRLSGADSQPELSGDLWAQRAPTRVLTRVLDG
jgi:hypothetical protein